MSNQPQFMIVVDDELDNMALFRDALSQMEDTNVCGFTDSTLALEHFKLNPSNYCLILSDFRMPNIYGMELLKKVKTINPSVKTVLISAFEVNEKNFEQSNCVDAFLQKPISIPDLIDAVETQISTT
jgi:DNA-binding NtrC family response regulator